MSSANDKRIAAWLGISIPTFYRWRRAGLLPRRPRSVEEAKALLDHVDAARDASPLRRARETTGRPRLEEVASLLRGYR